MLTIYIIYTNIIYTYITYICENCLLRYPAEVWIWFIFFLKFYFLFILNLFLLMCIFLWVYARYGSAPEELESQVLWAALCMSWELPSLRIDHISLLFRFLFLFFKKRKHVIGLMIPEV